MGNASTYSVRDELSASGTDSSNCAFTRDDVSQGTGSFSSDDGDPEAYVDGNGQLLIFNLAMPTTLTTDRTECGTRVQDSSADVLAMPPCPFTDPAQAPDPYYTATPTGAGGYALACDSTADFDSNGDGYHHHVHTTVTGSATVH